MTFYAFGLNYESAAVETVEAVALSAEAQEQLYRTLELSGRAEVVLLSTCNRTEAYLYGTDADVDRIQAALSARAGQPWPEAASFRKTNEAAIRHVLQVACSIRSMVTGDGQIFAQLKDAYQRAVDEGGVHSVMHRLMHAAFRAAKRVANETDLATGAASVSTAAIAMARDFWAERGAADLAGCRVLLVGAGKMGRLALGALDREAPAAVQVTNRSPARAEEVAAAHGAEPVAWADRHAAVQAADVVLVATGAPEPVLRAEALPHEARPEEARPEDATPEDATPEDATPEDTTPHEATPAGRETLLVDISMPRNVDPALDERDGCTVRDLDDLQAWTEQVEATRDTQVPRAKAICEEQLQEFVTWVFHQEAMQPAIQAIRDTFDAIREQEVERHAHRTDMDRAEVDRLTRSIMQKLLAVPIVKLKNVDPESIDFVQGIQLLHALFTRPACEDAAARPLAERPDAYTPSLDDTPSGCPFDPEEAEDADSEELIQHALRLTEGMSSS
jgi:glutamyl-tRNA reductase